MKGLSDIGLLDEYASHRSEEAFRELVSRHVDLIYSAATRQLRNPHLAQEATQSAFIALAGKAGQLRRQTVIAGWLHRAVHFAALNLQRSEARRKHWEEEAATMNVPGETEQVFQELALPHVDGALAELSESDRDALILRFLQQRSLRDVAQTLGTSEEAAKKRVSRALEKLRGLLAQRGVVIPAAVIAAGLAQMPITAAPAALPAALAALAANTVVPTVTSTATILALMASTKTKLGIIVGLVLLGGATAFVWHHHFPKSARASTTKGFARSASAMQTDAPSSNSPAATNNRDRSTPLRSMHSLLSAFAESDLEGALASLLFEKPEEEPIKAVLMDATDTEVRLTKVVTEKFGAEFAATVRRQLPMAGGPGVKSLDGAEETIDGAIGTVTTREPRPPYVLTKVGDEWKLPISYYIQKAGTPERFVEIHRTIIGRLNEFTRLVETDRFANTAEAMQHLRQSKTF